MPQWDTTLACKNAVVTAMYSFIKGIIGILDPVNTVGRKSTVIPQTAGGCIGNVDRRDSVVREVDQSLM